MACHVFVTNPLSELILIYFKLTCSDMPKSAHASIGRYWSDSSTLQHVYWVCQNSPQNANILFQENGCLRKMLSTLNDHVCWVLRVLRMDGILSPVVLILCWGQVMHICVSKLTIIGSDNGLSPDWRQAIIWTNAALLLSGPLGTNFSEILIEILAFSLKKMRLKVSSAKRRPFCLGLNVLM